MDDDIRILVARADVDHAIRLEPEETPTVQVVARRPFKVTFAYRLHEASRDEEQWRFWLQSRLSGGEVKQAEQVHKDRQGVHDRTWSYIFADHTCDAPGHYELQYEVMVETRQRPWGKGQVMRPTGRQQLSGLVRLHAEEA